MRKNIFLLMGIAAVLAACENNIDGLTDNNATGDRHTVRFNVEGDFQQQAMTRGSLAADGKEMTDLWLLDYKDGQLAQQLHQTATDADFGSPQMALDYGQHTLYFVCSRGKAPTLSTAEHIVTWGTVSDTFYKQLTIDVTSGTGDVQTVTLQRVATKLSIVVADAIPAGTEAVVITPSTWYYALDYLTGLPTDSQTSDIELTLGASFAGRENVSLSVFGLSGATEWTTDISVRALDGDDDIMGQAVIRNAPFKANRVTKYTGNLFSGDGSFSIALNGEWDSEYSGEW
jgi:hypothetical protein